MKFLKIVMIVTTIALFIAVFVLGLKIADIQAKNQSKPFAFIHDTDTNKPLGAVMKDKQSKKFKLVIKNSSTLTFNQLDDLDAIIVNNYEPGDVFVRFVDGTIWEY